MGLSTDNYKITVNKTQHKEKNNYAKSGNGHQYLTSMTVGKGHQDHEYQLTYMGKEQLNHGQV